MGLDTVELVMEVEESFGITIPEGRACQMRTVGDLYSFILEETRDQTRPGIMPDGRDVLRFASATCIAH